MRRLIFTLLYDRGHFMLSRNFRLQVVGTIDWLFDNYDFASVSRGLDELMVLDVSRGPRNPEVFAAAVTEIAGRCFIPVTVGGGITSFDIARRYMRSGADKLLVNSALRHDPSLCRTLANHFGRQCIVAGIDYRIQGGVRRVFTDSGTGDCQMDVSEWAAFAEDTGAGEILFQSVDKDGTGMGLDLTVVRELRYRPEIPCILMGGVGKGDHIVAGLLEPTVDAVATANLFNFIADSFLDVRTSITRAGIEIPHWDGSDYRAVHNRFSQPV